MSNRRVNVHGFLRNAAALIGGQVLERAHVVKTICQLYQHDPHVVDHRQQHLAHVFGLLFLSGQLADVGNLGEPFNQVGDFVTKIITDCIGVGEGVFDHVMQQARRNRDGIQPHVGENICDFERVDQVRLA